MTRLLIGSLLLASCSTALPDAADGGGDAGSFAGAFLSPDCAPDDGAALSLRLYEVAVPECSADTDHRVLSFYLFEGATSFLPIEAGETLTSSSASGSATACPGGEAPCRSGESWSLTFETYAEGTGASGTYTVTFDDGETVSGRFDAAWCDPGVVCG